MHFEQFLGSADSAGKKNHSLNQITVFQNVIKNHIKVTHCTMTSIVLEVDRIALEFYIPKPAVGEYVGI